MLRTPLDSLPILYSPFFRKADKSLFSSALPPSYPSLSLSPKTYRHPTVFLFVMSIIPSLCPFYEQTTCKPAIFSSRALARPFFAPLAPTPAALELDLERLVDEIGPDQEAPDLAPYLYIKKSSFIAFFVDNLIDVPICFKASKSLRFKNSELLLLKLVNFLMRKGLRDQTWRNLLVAFHRFYARVVREKATTLSLPGVSAPCWLPLIRVYEYLHSVNLRPLREARYEAATHRFSFFNRALIPLTPGLELMGSNKFTVNPSFFLKSFFLSKLDQILPIFAFYIYNVDKNVRKFSRGKSGKYIFIWKYIAPYKRAKTAIKLIAKQVKFYPHKTFSSRFLHMLLDLHQNPLNFAVKTKNFSYNYVFRNFKKTLMANYRTVTS